MPLAGKLQRMVHVPGRAFSVSPGTVRELPGVFARNERVISIFETEHGPLALALAAAATPAAEDVAERFENILDLIVLVYASLDARVDPGDPQPPDPLVQPEPRHSRVEAAQHEIGPEKAPGQRLHRRGDGLDGRLRDARVLRHRSVLTAMPDGGARDGRAEMSAQDNPMDAPRYTGVATFMRAPLSILRATH